MGGVATKFKEAEVGSGNVTGKLGKCISPSCVSKAPMKLTIKADMFSKKSTVTDDATGATVLTTSVSTGILGLTVSVFDGSGNPICVAVGKRGMTTGTFQIFKPEPAFEGQTKHEHGYVFSKGTCKLGLGTFECGYMLIKGGDDEAQAVPLYDVEKVGRMGLALTFTNQEGALAYCTALYCTVLYCTALHCSVLLCTALYCTVLYCTVQYRYLLLTTYYLLGGHPRGQVRAAWHGCQAQRG